MILYKLLLILYVGKIIINSFYLSSTCYLLDIVIRDLQEFFEQHYEVGIVNMCIFEMTRQRLGEVRFICPRSYNS